MPGPSPWAAPRGPRRLVGAAEGPPPRPGAGGRPGQPARRRDAVAGRVSTRPGRRAPSTDVECAACSGGSVRPVRLSSNGAAPTRRSARASASRRDAAPGAAARSTPHDRWADHLLLCHLHYGEGRGPDRYDRRLVAPRRRTYLLAARARGRRRGPASRPGGPRGTGAGSRDRDHRGRQVGATESTTTTTAAATTTTAAAATTTAPGTTVEEQPAAPTDRTSDPARRPRGRKVLGSRRRPGVRRRGPLATLTIRYWKVHEAGCRDG